MSPKLLIRGYHWMLWLWPALFRHPRFGFERGYDRRSRWCWVWCFQFWWWNDGAANNPIQLKKGKAKREGACESVCRTRGCGAGGGGGVEEGGKP